MPINYDKLLNWDVGEVRQKYSERDVMFYALSIGVGMDPLDELQLKFVFEKNLQVLPTFPLVLGYPGFWLKDPRTGVDWVRIVHGEQGIQIHRPIPVSGEVVGRTRVTDIVDKGPGKGALIYQERKIFDANTKDCLATLTSTTFARGDGGFGGPSKQVKTQRTTPNRKPDVVCSLPTSANIALLYRLNGDFNPLHADPAVAAAAGFPRPILHGLCTLGIAGYALICSVGNGLAHSLRALNARFSAPVMPGETIKIEIWKDGNVVDFRACVVERDAVVLSGGYAELLV